MTSNAKLVSAPLNIEDMDNDLESKTVYIFDYSKSELQGLDFLNYIKNTNVIADIFIPINVPEYTKITILEAYMNSVTFYHIASLNLTILNLIYIFKNSSKRTFYSIFTEEESLRFIESHKDILNEWIKIYDSLFAFMLILSTMDKNDILNIHKIRSHYDDSKMNKINNISPNVMSLLLDDAFYYYYQDGIDRNNVFYYPKYFEENLYDNKPLQAILFNDVNFIIKILFDLVHSEQFNDFVKNTLK